MRIKSTVRKDRMKITTAADINGAALRWLRARAGLSQAAFWSVVGKEQSTGANYETGGRPIPQAIRTLIFIHYVAGIELDASTEEGAAAMHRLALIQEADKAGVEHVGTVLAEAISHLKSAARALKTITQ